VTLVRSAVYKLSYLLTYLLRVGTLMQIVHRRFCYVSKNFKHQTAGIIQCEARARTKIHSEFTKTCHFKRKIIFIWECPSPRWVGFSFPPLAPTKPSRSDPEFQRDSRIVCVGELSDRQSTQNWLFRRRSSHTANLLV